MHENMRTAVLFGRFCLNRGSSQLLSRFTPPSRLRFARPPSWPQRPWKGSRGRIPVGGTLLVAALTPGAFLDMVEGGDGHDKTGEMQMLEASRREIQKSVAEDAQGASKLRQSLYVFWYYYVYDPITTSFRFVHLAIIFLPVIFTVPAVWFGRRIENRNGERTGTLWWYSFLVRSMERAGPAFIKVGVEDFACRKKIFVPDADRSVS